MVISAPPATAQDLARTVTIEGIESQDLRQELRALASVREQERRFTSLAAIRRTANEDANRMREALNSKGYYAADIVARALRDGDGVTVTFEITRGPRFDITGHRIVYLDETAEQRPERLADAGIEAGQNPAGEVLVEHETSFVTWLQENGYPNARAERHFVRANFETGRATAVYEIESGPRARFGDAVVSESGRTEESFIAAYAPWEEGELYDRRKVIDYREKLGETGLFQQISIDPGTVGEDGEADIMVAVTERKRRTVGAGLRYSTDVGPGVSLFWQNRNLLRRGERLTAEARLASPEQVLGLSFAKPLPTVPGSFNTSIAASNEISDAFEAKSLELNGSFSKTWFARKLEASAGAGYVYTEITDALTDPDAATPDAQRNAEPETFSYFKFPATITWNNSNDVLNPTRGFRTSLTATPFAGDVSFLRASLGGETRTTFGEENRFTLALRGLLGTSFGVSTEDIPATERFYAGGGGSIRGYAYQEAGPLDDEGDPIGGASILEINTEARYAVRDKLQLAVFVDGGTVSGNEIPDFSEDTLWGAGFGVRYLTPIGPLRADIATPLTPRDRDDAVHFYIALGQPF